jgi:hypothetical protein
MHERSTTTASTHLGQRVHLIVHTSRETGDQRAQERREWLLKLGFRGLRQGLMQLRFAVRRCHCVHHILCWTLDAEIQTKWGRTGRRSRCAGSQAGFGHIAHQLLMLLTRGTSFGELRCVARIQVHKAHTYTRTCT